MKSLKNFILESLNNSTMITEKFQSKLIQQCIDDYVKKEAAKKGHPIINCSLIHHGEWIDLGSMLLKSYRDNKITFNFRGHNPIGALSDDAFDKHIYTNKQELFKYCKAENWDDIINKTKGKEGKSNGRGVLVFMVVSWEFTEQFLCGLTINPNSIKDINDWLKKLNTRDNNKIKKPKPVESTKWQKLYEKKYGKEQTSKLIKDMNKVFTDKFFEHFAAYKGISYWNMGKRDETGQITNIKEVAQLYAKYHFGDFKNFKQYVIGIFWKSTVADGGVDEDLFKDPNVRKLYLMYAPEGHFAEIIKKQ